jgi:hypothetical protein
MSAYISGEITTSSSVNGRQSNEVSDAPLLFTRPVMAMVAEKTRVKRSTWMATATTSAHTHRQEQVADDYGEHACQYM